MHKFLLHTLPVMLLCLTSYAQPNPINRRAMAIAGLASSFTPASIGGIKFWWVSSDLPVGGTVTNWIDRIAGNHLTNAAAGTIPTNSTLGVFFDPNHPDYLNATNWVFTPTTDDFFIVYRMEFLKNTGSDDAVWLSDSGGTRFLGVYGSSSPKNQIWNFFVFQTITGAPTKTNTAQWFLNNTVTAPKNYTNGLDTTTTGGTGLTTIDWVGKTPANNGFLRSWEGYIIEMAVWTNKQFTASDVYNISNYCYTTYGITP